MASAVDAKTGPPNRVPFWNPKGGDSHEARASIISCARDGHVVVFVFGVSFVSCYLLAMSMQDFLYKAFIDLRTLFLNWKG